MEKNIPTETMEKNLTTMGAVGKSFSTMETMEKNIPTETVEKNLTTMRAMKKDLHNHGGHGEERRHHGEEHRHHGDQEADLNAHDDLRGPHG